VTPICVTFFNPASTLHSPLSTRQLINNVSDTARWVAVYRAMETERPDAHFRDPYAKKLAGDLGQKIVDSMKQGRRMAWAMIVRTQSIDELLRKAVRSDGVDLVVNLAAGLDARPWRMDLPASLRWVDVDLPGILDYKLGIIGDEKPKFQYEAIRVDLTDAAKRKAVLQQLGSSSQRALVISEGLLIYLDDADVRGLADDLAAAGGFKWWIFDLASPRLLRMMQKMWGRNLDAGNAPFKFAPAEGTGFFEKSGWKEAGFMSSMETATRLNREMPGLWMWKPLMWISSARRKEEARRMSGVVLLKREV
jgi:methyltransferase (TIGR00027 family)